MVKIEDLSLREEIILGTVAGTNQVLFVGNFLFALYNMIKHLIPLRISQPLIILFYAITFLMSISLMIETT